MLDHRLGNLIEVRHAADRKLVADAVKVEAGTTGENRSPALFELAYVLKGLRSLTSKVGPPR